MEQGTEIVHWSNERLTLQIKKHYSIAEIKLGKTFVTAIAAAAADAATAALEEASAT